MRFGGGHLAEAHMLDEDSKATQEIAKATGKLPLDLAL